MKTLAQLRAASAPTRPLAACAICSKIPDACSRFVKGGDVERDTIPPEAEQLVPYLAPVAGVRGEIRRCPTCHRLYWYDHEYEFIYGGSEDTYQYRRMDVDELFRDEWYLHYRFGLGFGDAAPQPFFRRHAFVRLHGVWHAVDDDNATTLTVATLDDVHRLCAIDPPVGLDDVEAARRYAWLVERLTSPPATVLYSFNSIRWRRDLTAEEKLQIEDLRAASRVEPDHAERLADRVLVKRWIISERRLIFRVLTVFPNGTVVREDAVIGEHLPI